MAHGKSLELRYNAPQKTHENLTPAKASDESTTPDGVFSFFSKPPTRRVPERQERKRKQLEQRRAAKARARANGKR